MELQPYVESIHRQLEIAAEAGGDDARALAERLAAPLDAAIRLALQDALVAAADEITIELAPGSVELRLRGREPRFVVTLPAGPLDDDGAGGDEPRAADVPPVAVGEEGAQARVNVRMPERLKAQVDAAAAGEGLSVNAWLVRAAAAAVERADASGRPSQRGPRGGQRYTGWAR